MFTAMFRSLPFYRIAYHLKSNTCGIVKRSVDGIRYRRGLQDSAEVKRLGKRCICCDLIVK